VKFNHCVVHTKMTKFSGPGNLCGRGLIKSNCQTIEILAISAHCFGPTLVPSLRQ
jgi:hypothetical protein